MPDNFPWGEPGDLFWEARDAGWGEEILRAYELGLTEGKERLADAARALYRETVYENGRKEEGIAVRFLMRMTMLANAAGQLADDEPIVVEARAALTERADPDRRPGEAEGSEG